MAFMLYARKLRATRNSVNFVGGLRMRQNITISVDQILLRKARVLAAERGTSVSRLIADELARLVDESTAYALARDAALADLDKGLKLGGRPASREALHER